MGRGAARAGVEDMPQSGIEEHADTTMDDMTYLVTSTPG